MFGTVLVANRGEIAVRVLRTLRRLGIRSVAVYSDADASALHVAMADVAVHIGPAAVRESYLNISAILQAAAATGAEAVHPGYGFLSENAAFARACADAGLVFIGPPPEAIEAMGDKIRAKQMVAAAGVPVVPGVGDKGMSDVDLVRAAPTVGFPLMVKASAGGGGKGMRVVTDPAALPDALAAARREARAAFGDDDLLLERYVTAPRHIEIQVFGDTNSSVVHLGERECSLQRRHQKVVEECPSPIVDEALRARMGEAAVQAARACGYVGAGTVEFIVNGEDPNEFFFLEMNTRLQVEHPVTEQVYGVDLVDWQLRVAAGEPLPAAQEELVGSGWAVEARVYAEDPARGFLPTGGTVLLASQPIGRGVRVDSGVRDGSVVTSDYDPLLAKVIGYGPDRVSALRRLDTALAGFHLLGVTSNVAFLRALLTHPEVQWGRLDTGLIDRHLDELVPDDVSEDVYIAAALCEMSSRTSGQAITGPFDVADGWRIGEHAWALWQLQTPGGDPVAVAVRGQPHAAEVRVGETPAHAAKLSRPTTTMAVLEFERLRRSYRVARSGNVVWLGRGGRTWAVRETDQLTAARHEEDKVSDGPLVAPMPGTVSLVNVAAGDKVVAGDTLVVVEAMKMEHPVTAPADGTVVEVRVVAGQQVVMEETLVILGGVGGSDPSPDRNAGGS